MVWSLRTDHRPGALVVAVNGDIDLATADQLDTAITKAIAESDAEVVIDLSATTFCDSSGIRALLHGRRLADARGVDYRAAGASGIVKEALEVTGVWALLNGDTPDGQRT